MGKIIVVNPQTNGPVARALDLDHQIVYDLWAAAAEGFTLQEAAESEMLEDMVLVYPLGDVGTEGSTTKYTGPAASALWAMLLAEGSKIAPEIPEDYTPFAQQMGITWVHFSQQVTE